jgi:3-oxoacyl-(acyl-carrier-protein) synthase
MNIQETQNNETYILSAQQISIQAPLSDEWMEKPVFYNEPYIRSIEPDYRQYFTPNEGRRYGKILKRALLVSRRAMQASGISNPDAIITGTGLGCIENTEIFLEAMLHDGEELLKPTHFMQSTHNTISSMIAIDAGCHGYNSTYAHKGLSFEYALLDGFLQLQSGQIRTALIGAHDEMTPNFHTFFRRTAYLGQEHDSPVGETSVALMLGTSRTPPALCRLRGLSLRYTSGKTELQHTLQHFLQQAQCKPEDIDAVMTGINGQPANDRVYAETCPALFPGKPLLRYKHLFGESFTAPALGIYASATCLARERISEYLWVDAGKKTPRKATHILVYNQCENKNHSFILLSSCGKSSC